MKSKLINDDGERTFALVLEIEDEVITTLRAFAEEHRLTGSHLTALGAFQRVTLGFFEWERKRYKEIRVDEQVEVLSLVGNIALDNRGKPKVHAHVVIGKADGTAHGGHLLEARVRPTLEVVLVESETHLQRRPNEEVGLPLISITE